MPVSHGSRSDRPAKTRLPFSAATSSISRRARWPCSTTARPSSRSTSLSRLRPGTYAVQALLHLNPDLNFANAPGDLYSPVMTVRLDPAAGGTISLELSRALARGNPARRHRIGQIRQDPLAAPLRLPQAADRPACRRDPAARLRTAVTDGATPSECMSAATVRGSPTSRP